MRLVAVVVGLDGNRRRSASRFGLPSGLSVSVRVQEYAAPLLGLGEGGSEDFNIHVAHHVAPESQATARSSRRAHDACIRHFSASAPDWYTETLGAATTVVGSPGGGAGTTGAPMLVGASS